MHSSASGLSELKIDDPAIVLYYKQKIINFSFIYLNHRIGIFEYVLNERRKKYLINKSRAEEITTIDRNINWERVKLYEQELKKVEAWLNLMTGFRESVLSATTPDLRRLHEAFNETVEQIRAEEEEVTEKLWKI